jgi:hypothetical protein
LNVSPLRVEFTGGALGDSSVIKELAYPPDEGRRRAVHRAEEKERFSLALAEWDKSGKTNSLKEVLDAINKETESPK